MTETSTEQLRALVEKLQRERGVDFRGYKPSTIGRRVQRRLSATRSPDIESYMKLLDQRPDEYPCLIDSILINVTRFFRDPEAWEVLRNDVLPQILAQKHAGDAIRFWSVGCATGEEPYSLAMLVSEALGSRISDYDVRIYATDIDDDALALARRAEYSDDAVAKLPQEMLGKYFTRNALWVLNRDTRKLVIFGRHNIATDAPISHSDLIVCRNVLIYMSVDLQNRVLTKLHYGIQPTGFLFLGKAESLLTASGMFAAVNERWRIFRATPNGGIGGRALAEHRMVAGATDESREEHREMADLNDAVLRHVASGIIAVDESNKVRMVNAAAESMWRIRASDLLGRSVMEVSASSPLQDVLPKILQTRSQRSEVRIEEMDLSAWRGKPFHVAVALSPMFDVRGGLAGVVLMADNVTTQVRLRSELEAAYEQLQATNEELETTNEELQSTNEELETTNEELQSTNEEMETTNEELQSTNEELSTTNDELAVRTGELSVLSLYLDSVMNSLDVPVVVLDQENTVTVWNPAAERFYGIKSADAVNRDFMDLSLPLRVARTRDKLRRLRESRKVYKSRPIEYTTRTGEQRSVVIEYQPLVDSQGNYQGAISIVRDASLGPIEPAGI